MNIEPINIWSKELETTFYLTSVLTGDKVPYTVEAHIIHDLSLNGSMFEGIIAVFIDGYMEEENEFSDSMVFATQKEALDFINECLNKWGFNVRLRIETLICTHSPIRHSEK